MWGKGSEKPASVWQFLISLLCFCFFLYYIFNHSPEMNCQRVTTFNPEDSLPGQVWAAHLSFVGHLLLTHVPSAKCLYPLCKLRTGMCRSQAKLQTSLSARWYSSLPLCIKVLETSSKRVCKKENILRKGEMLDKD